MPNKAKMKNKNESDTAYILKLVLYLILGSQWLFLSHAGNTKLSLPIGIVLGAAFAMHDHFQIDRKIEYAFLLVAMLVGYFAQVGIFISV